MPNLFHSERIIRVEQLDSTNLHALQLIKDTNPSGGTVVMALNQTEGRGQQTNAWESESGKNLTISLILRPDFIKAQDQFQVSMIVSLGVKDYLDTYSEDVSVKWPNDIYVSDKKIAGILIEQSIMGAYLSHSVCGIGLNINQKRFLSDAPNPISLHMLTNETYDLEKELIKLLASIENRYFQLLNGKGYELKDDYLKAMFWMKEEHTFKDEEGQFKGQIVGISEFGQLLIQDEEKVVRTYNFKEVSFIR
ncbi:biotin--[acetyl-CoA-carboxylase] ligase [Ancylomarina euxinus]|uniref:biotin--[biotin carboxyl-carrier protein] ligase n=1 Tax=Ancylomarina euxinus TaxID=2283627 RepID=A0A425Y3J3_9BACT|nr:biotin--[acetyl-CoA-carboxylase] ligase [Ancylomarina euxinus]MCZ4693148.1 biotin--[acetyl-CoA-carboxylase] ligase [Ancylomarina euxinus]MUP15286.1 biotin--[acetyl-CoA-carboxylase] ligase [Ancylomarina euxinus]RRG22584.1 biotin--[acetyl-CoA-carboxylase] ligase [Ancylomarina euxinus]